ncbi:Histidinol phosphate phosphatase, HisJ family [Desulfonema limicola]|uniref:Histidinol-phosphatase n=1 Tax=Desulfonema limicola TaxID=45656 RepID=A0A975GHJ1_9BACT|nr:histidinol-phosphatase [Desulfonema limicola]QTA81344.1 Histidinol phosphate phosphatase, HisJ family [Desulfonema limicola]
MENQIKNIKIPDLVSIHGGHSGQFCSHAENTLEEIITAYIKKGFKWAGITEHMPPVNDKFLYPDEIKAGLNKQDILDRFINYMKTCRKLQEKYALSIKIAAAFEAESYTGAFSFAASLIKIVKPDYIVGSVHHVHDIPIDVSKDLYEKAIHMSGGIIGLYCDYFDLQYGMINILKPQVIGHFDLIRIFDPKYPLHLRHPRVSGRIRRNLEKIKELDLILDFNVRALLKGADEPYISAPVLLQALELDIPAVPGDDSHGVDSVGKNIEKGISILQKTGFNTGWKLPCS